VNFARRQQYRRMWRASEAAFVATVLAVLGLGAASIGAELEAAMVLVGAAGLGLYAHHCFSLAYRSPVGARSEDAVQDALASLQAEGWRLRHSLPWGGRGDIDSVAIAPTGIAIVIETKTRSYDRGHLLRVHQQAAWLCQRRRRWARRGAVAVMCFVGARGVERVEDDVLVVSIDRLIDVLRTAAGLVPTRAD